MNNKLAKLAVNKSLLKEYSNSSNDRIVYMNDGTEFQIQIFNPYTYTIGISISFNGNQMPNMLVLKPGQRIWLERYLNESRKFLFETYEVNNSKSTRKAIAKNGEIELKFFEEKKQQQTFIKSFNNYVDPVYLFGSEYNSVASTGYNANYGSTAYNVLSANESSLDLKIGTNSKVNFCNSRSIETGRVERGGYSNQEFKNVYNEFENFPFKIETIKILPESTKQINPNDLQKRYCFNCGRKINQKFKFCPYCGTKLD